ncbi:MAG TPA: oxidoreductase [Solirubrobacteraceae bacterium]|nr:oxidoreductase [Solirubrobacteraceae bacterium]
MAWTAADIPSQAGRTIVVTGATSGLGCHTARELARAGAEVVLAVRDAALGEEVREQMGAAAVVRLDLADLSSVRTAAHELRERWPRLDVLVNNAGVMGPPRRETPDQFELQMATNHFGPFALTGLLLDTLRDGIVVTVASSAHRRGRIDLDDLQSERSYDRWRVYSQTKLANLLFAFELGRRAAAAGMRLRSVAAHPGLARTNLGRHYFQPAGPRIAGNRLKELAMGWGMRILAQSDARGALPSLYAVTVPDLPSGSYVGPSGPLEWRGHPKVVSASNAAHDEAVARRLWAASEELTGVRYLDA